MPITFKNFGPSWKVYPLSWKVYLRLCYPYITTPCFFYVTRPSLRWFFKTILAHHYWMRTAAVLVPRLRTGIVDRLIHVADNINNDNVLVPILIKLINHYILFVIIYLFYYYFDYLLKLNVLPVVRWPLHLRTCRWNRKKSTTTMTTTWSTRGTFVRNRKLELTTTNLLVSSFYFYYELHFNNFNIAYKYHSKRKIFFSKENT